MAPSTKNLRALLLLLVLAGISPLISEAFQTLRGAPGFVYSKSDLRRSPTLYRTIDGHYSGSEASQSDVSSSKKSLVTTIDDVGLSLKDKAVNADEKIGTAETKGKKFLFALQSCVLYALFIVYRGCRGFVAVLPPVARQVYSKLEHSVEPSPFEVAPKKSENVSWETRVTVLVLTGVLTASYVLRGGIRVVKKLFGTVFNTSNIPGSFAAAADEQEANEHMIMRFADETNGDNSRDAKKSSRWSPGSFS